MSSLVVPRAPRQPAAILNPLTRTMLRRLYVLQLVEGPFPSSVGIALRSTVGQPLLVSRNSLPNPLAAIGSMDSGLVPPVVHVQPIGRCHDSYPDRLRVSH